VAEQDLDEGLEILAAGQGGGPESGLEIGDEASGPSGRVVLGGHRGGRNEGAGTSGEDGGADGLPVALRAFALGSEAEVGHREDGTLGTEFHEEDRPVGQAPAVGVARDGHADDVGSCKVGDPEGRHGQGGIS
jgi:hypothetical protein